MSLPSKPTDAIPSSLISPGAATLWLAIFVTGVGTGFAAVFLTQLLEWTQHVVWGGSGTDLLNAAKAAASWRRIVVLLCAGVLTALGQLVLKRLSSGNSIDTTAAILFYAGRLPALRTLGTAVLSVLTVAMGASLGREGAPKQVGAVFANWIADRFRLSDEPRRLLVACAAGAGMSAAYGVPLGGALSSLEVMRGLIALRYVLPALAVSAVATAVSWIFLPDRPTYQIADYSSSWSSITFALVAGPIAGLASVAYVRAIAWAEQNKPQGWLRFVTPILGLGILGVASLWFPQLLGNGKDVSQLVMLNSISPGLLLTLLFLKPAATILCVRSGVPGGLFTPSLTFGVLLGAVLGYVWVLFWPGVPPGLFALLGAGAVLAATTQGPLSSVVLLLELVGHDRSFVLPLLIVVVAATLTARSIEPRSIYDAHLSGEEIAARQKLREMPAPALSVKPDSLPN